MNSSQSRFVADKLAKLEEAPGIVQVSLSLSNGCLANAAQVLESDHPRSVFGLLHNPFGYRVVDRINELPLSTRQAFQVAFRAACTTTLQVLSKLRVALPDLLNRFSAVGLAVGIGGDVGDAQVNSQNIVERLRRRFFNVHRNEEIPLASTVDKIGFTKFILQKLSLAIATHKRNLHAAIERRYRRNRLIYEETKVTDIVGNNPVSFERVIGRSVRLVGIGNLGDYPNGYLGRETKFCPQTGVDKLMQLKLPKDLMLPSNVAHVISGFVGALQRLPKLFNLRAIWFQLQLHTQFHNTNYRILVAVCQVVSGFTAVSSPV